MSTVPYTFATASGTIPLNQLDTNFANVKAFATAAGTVTATAQPNITSVGTLTSLSVTGNVTAANFIGTIVGNISNAVFATTAGTVTTAAQPNITSVGTLTSLSVTGNITSGNITSGNILGNYFIGNGSQLTGTYSNTNVTTLLSSFGSNTISTSGNVTGGNLLTSGNLVFSSTQVQSSAYAGGNGHAMMIDTNRTDTYVANGSADKPFKTFAAAIAAVATLNPTGTVPYTFVLMGCSINEDVDFTPYNFNFITISTTCRSVFNNPVTFGNSALKQLTVRNVEFADTLTITGDGTADQLNNTSFYNVSFNGAVTVTAANSLAFYEASFFDTVDFVNVNYVYINAAQFNSDWTITVSDSDPVPANGIGPAQVISLDLIANHVYLVDSSASGFIVFQPQNARMGRSDGAYTIPASCVFNPYNSVLIGTWTNNGTATFRNSVSNNAIANVTPTYTGYMGGTAISISGNITGGNISTSGNITAGNVIATNLSGPVFMANVSTGQGIPTSPSEISELPLMYDNISANIGGGYAVGNSVIGSTFTAPVPGFYQVSSAIGVTPSNWANVASYNSAGVIGVYVNDNPVASGPLIDFAGIVIGNVILQVTTSSSISTLVELNAGDTLQCKLAYSTTAPSNFWNTSTNLLQGYFQAAWIRS